MFDKIAHFKNKVLMIMGRFNTKTFRDLANLTIWVEKSWGLILLTISVVVFFMTTLLPSAKKITHGFAAYFTASRLVIEHRGGSIFYDDNAFQAEVTQVTHGQASDIYWANPPTTAVMFMPLASLSIDSARRIWTCLSLISLVLGVVISGLVIFKTPFQTKSFFLAASVLFLSVPVAANFQYGQAYTLIFLFYTIALFAMNSGLEWLAGSFVALALALKASGLPLLVLLILRGRWRIVMWVLLVFISVTLLSIPLVGLSTWRVYVFVALPNFLADPVIAATAYQTIPSFIRHLFTYDHIWNPNPLVHWPTFASVISLLMTIGLVGIASWRSSKTSPTQMFCLGLILSVILVPAAEQHHYVLLLPAIFFAVHSPTTPKPLLYVSAALLALSLDYTAKDFTNGGWALLAYPRLYGAILLFIALCYHEDDILSRDVEAINIDAYSRTQ